MKKIFINYTRYEWDEWINIHYIGTDLDTSVQEFKKNLKESLSIGPDDCHSFNLVQVNLKNKDYERLMKIELESDLDDEDLEFFVELSENYNFDSKLVCFDDNSGNIEIVNIYCNENNLDSEDDGVFEDVYELLMNDESLYDTYIDKYLNTTF